MRYRSSALACLFSIVVVSVTAACTPPATGGDGGVADGGAVDQTPPEGDADMQAWLDEEHYVDWTCQPAIGDAHAASPHGRRRICHNDALATALDGEPLPVGSAVVKEIYNDADERAGTAVLLKVGDGTGGDSWYWYERTGVITVTDGRDAIGCVGCHEGAESEGGREMVYVTVE